jgi:hypothetical protein
MHRRTRISLSRTTLAIALLGCAATGWAQFDPSKVVVEPEAIARQFPDPAMQYATPGLAARRQDFTSHAEVFTLIDALARRSPRLGLETIGHSPEGRAVVLLVLSGSRGFDPELPTVMVLGQQHGNEPAGGEATLALAQSLATERSAC